MVGGRCVAWMEAGGVEGDGIEERRGRGTIGRCMGGGIVVPTVGV